MRHFLTIAIIAFFALVSCKKDPIQAQVQLNLNISDKAGYNGAGTKAIKTGWEDEDKIYLFFSYTANFPVLGTASAKSYVVITYKGGQWLVADELSQQKLDNIGKNIISESPSTVYALYVAGDRNLEAIEEVSPTAFSFGVSSSYSNLYGEIQEATSTPFTLVDDVITASLQFSQLCTQVVVTNIDSKDNWRIESPVTSETGVTHFRGIKELKVVGYNSKNYTFFDQNVAFGMPNADGVAFHLAEINDASDPVYVMITNLTNNRCYFKEFPAGKSLQLGKAYKFVGPELDEYGNIINPNGWRNYVEYNKIYYTKTSSAADLKINAKGFGKGVELDKFSYYGNYGEIIFKSNVSEIGEETFRDQTVLTGIVLPTSLAYIRTAAFSHCSNLRAIEIPGGVKHIGTNAFISCNNLRYVILNEGLERIATTAFQDCTSLQSLNLPHSLKTIDRQAFSCCENISGGLYFSENITSIDIGAFEGCRNIESITFAGGSLSIGQSAFGLCENLRSVVCKIATPPVLGNYVFEDIHPEAILYVPTESVEAYQSSSWGDYFSKIEGVDF